MSFGMDHTSHKTTTLRIGYARVSTHEQSLDSQTDALKQAGCDRIYADKISGIKSTRPKLGRLKETLRPGDTLIIWRLDRLGRSLKDLIEWTDWLNRNDITLHSLTEQIDTSHPAGKLTFHLFASLAEFERNLIRERTSAGLIAARARGRKGGRPNKLDSTGIRQLRTLHQDTSLSVKDICKRMGIGKTAFYRYLTQT